MLANIIIHLLSTFLDDVCSPLSHRKNRGLDVSPRDQRDEPCSNHAQIATPVHPRLVIHHAPDRLQQHGRGPDPMVMGHDAVPRQPPRRRQVAHPLRMVQSPAVGLQQRGHRLRRRQGLHPADMTRLQLEVQRMRQQLRVEGGVKACDLRR